MIATDSATIHIWAARGYASKTTERRRGIDACIWDFSSRSLSTARFEARDT